MALRKQFGVRVKAGSPPLQRLVVVGTYRAFTPTHDECSHELLLLYGDGYWVQLRQLAVRLQGHRANLAAQQQRLRVDSGAPAASAASGGEVGACAAAPAAGGGSGGSDQPAAPVRFVPQPLLAGPGRGAPAAAAAVTARQVRFAFVMPLYGGAAFDRSAAKRHAAAEDASAFGPAACAAGLRRW